MMVRGRITVAFARRGLEKQARLFRRQFQQVANTVAAGVHDFQRLAMEIYGRSWQAKL